MTTISIEHLAAITGGNAAGNGRTGDQYRANPSDDGSHSQTRQHGLASGALGAIQGARVGGTSGNFGRFGKLNFETAFPNTYQK